MNGIHTTAQLPIIMHIEKNCMGAKYSHDSNIRNDNELYALQAELGKQTNIEPDKNAARAAMGLTEFEAETAYALSLIRKGRFSARVISEAKSQMIRKSGLMEFWSPADINDVGGLGDLKSFIQNRAKAFAPENVRLPHPKGLLLVGIPGTGKSLSSKATASMLGWPLSQLNNTCIFREYFLPIYFCLYFWYSKQ